jgi:hypothetical protein
MSPDVLAREEVSVDNVQLVPEGFSGRVVPSAAFADVALDPGFTGAASRGARAPYFSQLDNLDDMVTIYTPYAPAPVRDRVVYVRINVMPVTIQAPGRAFVADAPEPGAAVTEGSSAHLSLAELTERMRGLVDLPVQDLARMCGIGRRQYYNLLRRKAEMMKTAEGEQRLRLVHHYLRELHAGLGNASAVRAAILMPLPAHGARSLLDIGTREDLPALQDAYSELTEHLAAGVAPSTDVLPPSGKFPADDERWVEAESFMRNYRPNEE